MSELAKLEGLSWAKDHKVAESVFPYVLIEAINLLKNSKIIERPIDYAKTGEEAQKLLKEASV